MNLYPRCCNTYVLGSMPEKGDKSRSVKTPNFKIFVFISSLPDEWPVTFNIIYVSNCIRVLSNLGSLYNKLYVKYYECQCVPTLQPI